MTTRPYLFAFAASVAGLFATGPVVAVLAFGGAPEWWMGGWLLSFVPVFCLVAGGVMHAENQLAAAQRQADLKQQQTRTAALAWDLKLSQRQAAVASGQAGAREAEARERAWGLGLEILFRAGEKAGGFSGRKLAGCVGSDTHPALMEFYTSPAGLCILRDAGGNRGHAWGFRENGELWTLADVLDLIRAGKCPHPEGDVPEIKPLPASATQRNTPRKAATQVIDG